MGQTRNNLGASAQESESTSRKGWRGGVGSAAKNEKCVESHGRRGGEGGGRGDEEERRRDGTPGPIRHRDVGPREMSAGETGSGDFI